MIFREESVMATFMVNCRDYQDLSLIEIGEQKCSPLYSFGPFVRNEYIFHYVLSGKGYVSCNDESRMRGNASSVMMDLDKNGITVNAGEGFLIEPHARHIYYADEQEPWHYIWVVFTGIAVPQYLQKCGLSRSEIIWHPKDHTEETRQNVRNHLMTILQNPNEEPAFILGHFSLFFHDLICNSKYVDNLSNSVFPKKYTAMSNYYLAQATSYIHNKYCQIRSLDEIADFCHISRSHLGRIFRENLHMSLQEYLIQFRLNKAKDLLSTTSAPIGEIAAMVGYQNELNLLRAFKKAYGITPHAWRNQNSL